MLGVGRNLRLPPVTMGARTTGVPRGRAVERQIDQLSVSYPSFGDDVIAQRLDVFTWSLQNRHLHAALVVQVDVKRRLREIVVIVWKSRVSRFGSSRW